jgi:diguanylate cyclase (GGDEF)-like protein
MLGRVCSECGLRHTDHNGFPTCQQGCGLLHSIQSDEEFENDLFIRHRDGHRVRVSVRVLPIHDANGTITGAAEIFREVTLNQAVSRRIQELETLALLDPLTRLPNRRSIEANLQMRLEELNRYGWPFGVLFADIDHFKSVNDVYGHDVGDQMLRLVSKTLLSSLRPFDVLGRWGGEEFLGIVVNVDREDLLRISERARRLVERSYLPSKNGPIRATISIGATTAEINEDAANLVKRADKLMYASKLAGRNRVTLQP